MPGSAVHGRLRFWSVLRLSTAVAVASGPTAALADTGTLSEQGSQATEQVADSAGMATEQVADSAAMATEQVADSAGMATEQVADSAGTATEQVADSAGTATSEQVADNAGTATTEQVADAGGKATQQVADTAGKATEQVADTAGKATEQVADTAGKATEQVAGTAGSTSAQATDTIGQTAAQATDTIGQTAAPAASTVGKTAAQATDTIGQTAEHVTDTAWQTTSSAGSYALPVIERETAPRGTADASGTGIAFRDASTALTVGPAEELASGYQGVLLWDAVVAAARNVGARFDLAWAQVADACGAQCEKTGFGLIGRDSFAEKVASLIRFLAITGLQLIGLMWRALAAALVGVFLVSLARRRESQYLLATGGYTERWR
jgi:hypothetical protein